MHVSRERLELAKKRLRSVLQTHGVATARILEQKISDAGPNDQRIDPHILTSARNELEAEGEVIYKKPGDAPWYHLVATDPDEVVRRLGILEPIREDTLKQDFRMRAGQALEIAVFKALRTQTELPFFGSYTNLEEHDDSTLYKKEEPPSWVSGKCIGGGRKFDYLAMDSHAGPVGIEVKNVGEWLYPDQQGVKDLVSKCCEVDAVPVLVGRRIPYVTYSVLNPCGVILHQTYNQRYPNADRELADQARHKKLLGYHDIRVGNEPDDRLITFVHHNLPMVLDRARKQFERNKGVLRAFVGGGISYGELGARVRDV